MFRGVAVQDGTEVVCTGMVVGLTSADAEASAYMAMTELRPQAEDYKLTEIKNWNS